MNGNQEKQRLERMNPELLIAAITAALLAPALHSTERKPNNADAYETKNLIGEDSAVERKQRLMEEFDRQVKAIRYHEPAGADKPGVPVGVPKRKKRKK